MKKIVLIILLIIGVTTYAQQYKSHKVAKGENVYRIAKRYNTTPELIYKMNPTAKDGIAEGEILAIPVSNDQEYNTYEVAQGDTVYSIAKKYDVSVDTILLLNPEASNGINVGQVLNVGKIKVPNNTEIEKDESGKDSVLEGLEASDEPKIIRFITHKVKKKETLYSISKKYDVTIEDIKKNNKRLYSEPLKKKDEIRIPVYEKFGDLDKKENPESRISVTTKYTIQPKDTKFSIARRHGITTSEFDKLNPGLDPNLPIGTEIVVPTTVFIPLEDTVPPGYELYEVKPKETMFGILKRTKISSDSLIKMNPYLRDGLKAGMVITIPRDTISVIAPKGQYLNLQNKLYNFKPKKLALMLPFCLDTLDFENQEYTTEYLKKKQSLRIALDLYNGVLIAVDSAKKVGITTELSVYDTKKGSNQKHIKKLLEEHDFDEVDVVIGPLFQSNAEFVAAELKKYETPVFSPGSKKESNLYDNFFQTRPTNAVLQEKMLSYVAKDSMDKNIVIIVQQGKKHEDIKSKLSAQFPNAKIAKIESGNYLYEVHLNKVLHKSKPNWVFLESDDIAMISNVIPLLNAKAESHKITLFTTDKNSAFDNDSVKNEHFSRLHLHYPSVGKEFDDKGMEGEEEIERSSFAEQYHEQYGIEPSNWVVRGFDITYDILMRLGTADDVYHSASFGGSTEYVENKFSYSKKLIGGYYNDSAYLIRFEDDLKLKVIE